MPVRVEAGAEPIPGYTFIERLGGGGFGEVWKVEAPGGLHKAIKVVYGDLQTTDPDGTRRAEQELKALKRVQSVRHPYLLSLERYDIIEGRLLIVMELADRNLWDRFRECRTQNIQGIPRDELMRYMEETAEVLDLMNQQYQLQHLDIKPQNLFLVHNHAKVADFGLVKDLEGMMATVTGGITPVYAAPETFDGVVSRFCDQYSLAIVYQELLTGQRPFNGTSLQQLIMQHLSAQPNVSLLPKGDRAAINKSLAKKPEQRFPSCMDLVRALRTAGANAELAAVKPSAAPPAPKSAPPRPSQQAPMTERPQPDRGLMTSAPAALGRPELTPDRPSRLTPSVEETGPPVQEAMPPRQAPPEMKGEGVLFPAVIVGVGQKGLEVLQVLREAVVDRFGSMSALPNLRLLYLDTDPDAVHAATHDGAGPLLEVGESYLARLNRPSHYLKLRDGRMSVDAWFNPKLLYRIPRNPLTTGIRALGRLAFVDNYRTIASRLRTELETSTKPETLSGANRHTRLGMRTNYPRVYVVAGLGGGTGGGMFLDVAYVCRSLLRHLGYINPDVVGLFLVPGTERLDKQGARTVAVGNAYAALTELHHFTRPDVTFSFRYDDREAKLKDRDPPFGRTILMGLEPEGDKEREGEATRRVGDWLFRELATPLGKTADAARPAATPAEDATETTFQTMGLYRFSWPRRALLQTAARHLCLEIGDHWMSKDGAAVRDVVRNFLAEELTRLELDPEHLVAHLQEAVTQALGQTADSIFASLVEPFVPKAKRPPDPESSAVLQALGRMEQLLGKPGETPGKGKDKDKEILVDKAMESTAATLVKDWGEKLSQIVLGLVERPDFRLAGAEEAIRQLSDTIERVLGHHETLARELTDRATEAHSRVHSILDSLRANPNAARRNAPLIADLAEALKQYPRCRYQSLQLRRVTDIYISLRGQLSEQVREVNFCRNRLGELVKDFAEAAGPPRAFDPVPGACLLPANCRNLDDAIRRMLDALTPRDLKDLDQRFQAMIEEQFTALVHVCLASDNLVRELGMAMQQQAENFMGARLVGTNVVEMFLSQRPRPEEACEDIVAAFDDARPNLVEDDPPENEIRVLALPPGPLGEQFKALAQQALPEAKLAVTESADDIVIYREWPQLPLASLKLMGAPGESIYRQMNSSEAFPPHTRIDILDWQEVK